MYDLTVDKGNEVYILQYGGYVCSEMNPTINHYAGQLSNGHAVKIICVLLTVVDEERMHHCKN